MHTNVNKKHHGVHTAVEKSHNFAHTVRLRARLSVSLPNLHTELTGQLLCMYNMLYTKCI